MKLFQRVAALIRANINDLIDGAADPEKLMNQLLQDLNNQLIQVKTAVAQALADQNLIENRLHRAEEERQKEQGVAEEAVRHGDDAQARAALLRGNSHARVAKQAAGQLDDQRKELDALKLALSQLETKMAEATRQRELVLARYRRAAARERLVQSGAALPPDRIEELLDTIAGTADRADALSQAREELDRSDPRRLLMEMDESARIEAQLAELKERLSRPGA